MKVKSKIVIFIIIAVIAGIIGFYIWQQGKQSNKEIKVSGNIEERSNNRKYKGALRQGFSRIY